ncbi:MAG: hypothetical protein QOH67_2641 [Hyphomicrobiales bacterium]|jgi:hypothetical protein|nr:hypothetical protein [Hyphomicrobiales bacterium]
MLTKTKIALAATLFAATSSVAMAQGFDPNLANRYPHLANPIAQAPQATAPRGKLQSAPVRLQQGRNAGVINEQPSSSYWGPTEIDVDRADRASSPYAGGGY